MSRLLLGVSKGSVPCENIVERGENEWIVTISGKPHRPSENLVYANAILAERIYIPTKNITTWMTGFTARSVQKSG